MKLKSSLIFIFCLGFSACFSTKGKASKLVEITPSNAVKNTEEFKTAIASVQPGDTIIIANGTWENVELKFEAKGTAENKIYILAEEKGKVFFEGQSNVKMGGEHLHLEGLVFRNGYTATSAVVSLQKDKETPCNYCRVTQCVVDNYNPPERFDTNYWIEIYGKHNRFDHNYLVGKRNRGVTLAVRLKNERDRENYHQIDHNYFGYHPALGSNGGETLRVGTSHYSLSNSNTTVEDNYFERCSGELEIISSKSCQNTFRNNTFYECAGTLTMRHGNETLVENNYFFGNRMPNTGGIRVINETQTVRNNYLYGLTGYRFRGALVIMNGVPNSPLNRYFQVIDSEVSNNLIVDCDHIQLCAGSDEERSATPKNTSFQNNIIYNTKNDKVFTIYDDVSGINFEKNIISSNIKQPSFNKKSISGFKNQTLNFSSENEVIKANEFTEIGAKNNKERPTAQNTGVSWYPKKNYQIEFSKGKIIQVEPGENTLVEAIKNAEDGDIIQLISEKKYHITRSITIDKTITIEASVDVANANITFERSPLFALENGGSLDLDGLNISGKEADDYSGNSVIRTSRYSMINNYKLKVHNCNISDLDVNHSFNFLRVYKNTFADSISITNTNFKNITGHILNLDKEYEDRGIYNAETIIIDNCDFKNIGGSALKLYRGGRDESTFGPILYLSNTNFKDVGNDKRNGNESAIHLHGVQHAEMNNITIKDSRKINLHLIVGEPVICLNDIDIINSEKVESNSEAYETKNVNYK